jgi:hypothetical protein
MAVTAVPFFASRNVVFASAFLFIPLPLVAWLLGLSGLLIGHSIALPCVVGLTHFVRTRQLPHSRAVRGA